MRNGIFCAKPAALYSELHGEFNVREGSITRVVSLLEMRITLLIATMSLSVEDLTRSPPSEVPTERSLKCAQSKPESFNHSVRGHLSQRLRYPRVEASTLKLNRAATPN